MKKLIALAALALAPISGTAEADDFSFSYYSGGYQPYRSYSYIAPPTYYVVPSGYYVQRQVVRPYYRPYYHYSGWYNDRDHRHRDKGHHRGHGRGHDRGHDHRR
jgi:hypothetical protein